MGNSVYISDLLKHAGKSVTLKGWVYSKRSSGKVKFLMVRDGTGTVQNVLVKGNVPDSIVDTFDKLTQESSIQVTGKVREDKRAKGGVEMDLEALEILQIAQE